MQIPWKRSPTCCPTKPPDMMPVDVAERDMPPLTDANDLLWAARLLASVVRVHRNVIPDVREEREAGRGDPGELRRCA
jgi:hypothetical protein